MKITISNIRIKAATRAAFIHLIFCLICAILVGGIVFLVWYPGAYRHFSGGTQLFAVIITVDVICGPFLTLILFNPTKSRAELFSDLGFIILLQCGALLYGTHIVAGARPVWLAFDVDRFRVISAIEIEAKDLPKAPPHLQKLSWSGPKLLGVRVAKPEDLDYLENVLESINNRDSPFRPERWQSFDKQHSEVAKRLKRLEDITEKSPEKIISLKASIAQTGVPIERLRWLPLQSRDDTGWIALVDTQGVQVVGFVEIDGFQ